MTRALTDIQRETLGRIRHRVAVGTFGTRPDADVCRLLAIVDTLMAEPEPDPIPKGEHVLTDAARERPE